jgi:hypothetical protein
MSDKEKIIEIRIEKVGKLCKDIEDLVYSRDMTKVEMLTSVALVINRMNDDKLKEEDKDG